MEPLVGLNVGGANTGSPDVRRRVLAGGRALRDRLRLRRERIGGRRANGFGGGGANGSAGGGGGGKANGAAGGGGGGERAGGGGGTGGARPDRPAPEAAAEPRVLPARMGCPAPSPDQSGREDRGDQPSSSSAAAYVTSSRTNFVQCGTARRAALAIEVLARTPTTALAERADLLCSSHERPNVTSCDCVEQATRAVRQRNGNRRSGWSYELGS